MNRAASVLCLSLIANCGCEPGLAQNTSAPVKAELANQEWTAPPTSQGNLLSNPSFESNWFNQAFASQKRFLLLQASDVGLAEKDGHIDYWAVRGASPVACWEPTLAHSGRLSLHFTQPASATQRLRMCGENGWQVGGASYGGFFPLAKALCDNLQKRDLVVGAWCKTVDSDSPPTLSVRISFADRPKIDAAEVGAVKTLEQQVHFGANTHDWEYQEIKLDASKFPGTPYFAEVTVESSSKKGGVWFDDASACEQVPGGSKNLLANPDFSRVDARGSIVAWSSPQLWEWFRNEYYTWTGWSHLNEKTWRGSTALDPLVTYNRKPTLRFSVFPGDNFAVASAPVILNQSQIQPLEVRAMVKADNLRTLEIMAKDEEGHWLPQGDFLGDSMEDDPGSYNMGTTGSGTYGWRCVRKYFSPRKPLGNVRIYLCARGFDGKRPARDIVGTAWFTQVQLYQHGPQPAWCSAQNRAPGTESQKGKDIEVDLGQRLFGKNLATVTMLFSSAQRKDIEAAQVSGQLSSPSNISKAESGKFRILREPTQATPGLAEAKIGYTVEKMCSDFTEQYRLRLTLESSNETREGQYSFGTPPQILETEADSYYPSPKNGLQALCRLNISDEELKNSLRLELLQTGADRTTKVLQTKRDFHGIDSPRPSAGGADASRSVPFSIASALSTTHPWTEPTRDQSIRARIYSPSNQLVGQSEPFVFGFLEDPPDFSLPAPIVTTGVNQRGYIEVNGKPYFPVYWTPNFERKSFGNYPPRFAGARTQDLNPVVFPHGELPQPLGTSQLKETVGTAKSDPRLFGYEVGDGEMQLQGATWPARLAVASQAIRAVRQMDPNHVICGPESWLIGHPGHDETMPAFAPLFDVIGVETSFEEVPKANQYARPFWGQGHACAVLAGLEAYFFQPPESLRWRGYRSVYEGCAGVGLCPSEMLKARAVVLTYLKGLNGEFRGLERVFTAAQPAVLATYSPSSEVQVFERELEGRHYLFAIRAPGKKTPQKMTFKLQNQPQAVKVRFEGRTLSARGGEFSDDFTDQYSVHIYEY